MKRLVLAIALSVTLAPPARAGSPSFSGWFDAYYAHFFNGVSPYTGGNPEDAPTAATTAMRKFDLISQQFAINLVELDGLVKSQEAEFRFALNFGGSVDLVHAPRGGRDINALDKYVGQAYVTYRPAGVSGLAFSFGKIPSQMGGEEFHSQQNANYSRSFLYSFGLPYWYTGVRVTYAAVPGLLLLAVNLGNGWNSFFTPSGARNVGARIGLTPLAGLQLFYNGAFGSQQVGSRDSHRAIHELNVTYASSDDLQATADVLFGTDDAGNAWKAGWLGVRIGFPGFFLAPRIELFRDAGGGQTRTDQMLYAQTLTAGIRLSEGAEGRLEFRHDQSDHDVFATREGALYPGSSSLSAALLYSF